ncbi:beta-aspartyl-peptidase (threonine type) [Actinomadura pelletieri DSM 43383]|uniref:Beta-aspartyl-peptidase (Threonine type) n=1 Tax=Actinomadura pelletieri DSM 43383 TaxID=1120940 RepID=A0A495QA73_9ACTN|nr:isoaspartyl peptidase/L-asparaginase [Actinomadura pelletieri]RKS68375.1 beta-aspartyl-peptidase (threonine type) [Actinomadura pelletieri DSM 43383]
MPSPKRSFLLSTGLALLVVGLSGSQLTAGAATAPTPVSAPGPESGVRGVVLAVHGGAGSLPRGSLTPEQEKSYRDGLTRALRAGYTLIKDGRPALDAVEEAVKVLEDDPNFNAGKGAVFNTDAEHELDASIMNGADRRSGAVAGVRHTKNPISLARLVMEKSPHVFMAGKGADEFALRNGVPYTTQDHFWTQRRWDQLLAAKGGRGAATAGGRTEVGGTVGATAVDGSRNLAAATSTGGLTNKQVGRVGDSPVIGAGTYADNRTVAISCTGTGEVFIRGVAAYDVSALMEYARMPVTKAAATVVNQKIPALGATGGAIALDARGRLAAPHSTKGIINGYVTRGGEITTRLYDDETPTG